jgi:5-methylcytosine-specific restriction endonuclease McrA
MVTKKKAIKKKVEKKPKASPTSSKKKEKQKPIDGYGPIEKKKIRIALRLIWQRSKQWKIVKDRCTDNEGYFKCEKCGKRVPKIKVDHRVPIGDIDDPGFLERLMVPSSELDGLCDPCHDPKTKKDNAETKAKKRSRKVTLPSLDTFI